jgi:hypothetical protein
MNNTEEEFYRQKYLKYKAKYLEAKNKLEGGNECYKIKKRSDCLSQNCKYEGISCKDKDDCDKADVGNCLSNKYCILDNNKCRTKNVCDGLGRASCFIKTQCSWKGKCIDESILDPLSK